MIMEFTPKWQKYFMEKAFKAATMSKDPSTKHGAVLVNNDKIDVSTGFNGLPRRIEDKEEYLTNRDIKYTLIIHSEMNAILQCPVPTKGLHLFVTGLTCSNCAKHLVAAGIETVYYCNRPEHQTGEYKNRWADEIKQALFIYESAGVPVFSIDYDSLDL